MARDSHHSHFAVFDHSCSVSICVNHVIFILCTFEVYSNPQFLAAAILGSFWYCHEPECCITNTMFETHQLFWSRWICSCCMCQQMYIDPKNPRHAREEAETLLLLSDTDHDGNLSLREIFNKMDLFLGSKMVDTARNFHDEFWAWHTNCRLFCFTWRQGIADNLLINFVNFIVGQVGNKELFSSFN